MFGNSKIHDKAKNREFFLNLTLLPQSAGLSPSVRPCPPHAYILYQPDREPLPQHQRVRLYVVFPINVGILTSDELETETPSGVKMGMWAEKSPKSSTLCCVNWPVSHKCPILRSPAKSHQLIMIS